MALVIGWVGFAAAAEDVVELSGVTVRQVWADQRTNTLGQPSLDGRYLCFTDWETGDLALRDLKTGRNRRLTHKGSWRESAEYAHFSTISPDSTQVAYAWFNKDKYYELRVVDTQVSIPPPPRLDLKHGFTWPASVGEPSEPRVLYRSDKVQFIKPACWSYDGKYILALFFGKSILNQIVLVSTEDGSVRILKTPFWIYPKRMSLSPDGRYVVYGINQEPPYLERDIFLLPTDGRPEIPLVKHPANDLFPMWAPDNRTVLFASTRSGTLDAYTITVDDGHPAGPPRLVKRDIGRFMPLGFTAAGEFYYGLRTGDENAFVATIDLTTGKLQGDPVPVSPRFAGVNRSPAWSPDGRRLAYLTHVGTENQGLEFRVITVREEETGQERQLSVPGLGYLGWLRWAPDGRSFLVGGSDTNNVGGLFRVDAETAQVTMLVKGYFSQGRGFEGVYSTDGAGVFYVNEDLRKRSYGIHFRNLENGEDRRLFHVVAPWRLNNLALSPDGKSLAFGMSEGNRTEAKVLLVMPAAGGEPRELLRLDSADLSGFEWTPDSETLLFSRVGDPSPQLWRIPANGGKPRTLKLKTNRNARISLHPDGNRIAYTAGVTNLEVWAMDGILPKRPAAAEISQGRPVARSAEK